MFVGLPAPISIRFFDFQLFAACRRYRWSGKGPPCRRSARNKLSIVVPKIRQHTSQIGIGSDLSAANRLDPASGAAGKILEKASLALHHGCERAFTPRCGWRWLAFPRCPIVWSGTRIARGIQNMANQNHFDAAAQRLGDQTYRACWPPVICALISAAKSRRWRSSFAWPTHPANRKTSR